MIDEVLLINKVKDLGHSTFSRYPLVARKTLFNYVMGIKKGAI